MLDWFSKMPIWLVIILQIAFFAFVALVVYRQLKLRVLHKYNPNKWILLAIAFIIFMFPMLLNKYAGIDIQSSPWQYVDSTIFVIFFLWFIDVNAKDRVGYYDNKRRKAKTVIKPKAKPNRAKRKDT